MMETSHSLNDRGREKKITDDKKMREWRETDRLKWEYKRDRDGMNSKKT